MAYYRPRRYTPRRAPARPRRYGSSVYRKTVKPYRQAVPALARTVQKLKRKVLAGDEVAQYSSEISSAIGNLAGNNQFIYPISQFSRWNRTFGADATDEQNNQMLWRKTNIDMEFDNNGERNNIDYTMYIVSLTKMGQLELLNAASGTLNTPLVNGVHYQVNGTYGQAFLNRKYFNVVRCKRFVTGIYSGLTTEPQGLRKRFYFKFSHNKGRGFLVKNPSGDWKAKACPQIAGHNMFVIVFNNDSTTDTAVQLRANILHTIEM